MLERRRRTGGSKEEGRKGGLGWYAKEKRFDTHVRMRDGDRLKWSWERFEGLD